MLVLSFTIALSRKCDFNAVLTVLWLLIFVTFINWELLFRKSVQLNSEKKMTVKSDSSLPDIRPKLLSDMEYIILLTSPTTVPVKVMACCHLDMETFTLIFLTPSFRHDSTFTERDTMFVWYCDSCEKGLCVNHAMIDENWITDGF